MEFSKCYTSNYCLLNLQLWLLFQSENIFIFQINFQIIVKITFSRIIDKVCYKISLDEDLCAVFENSDTA